MKLREQFARLRPLHLSRLTLYVVFILEFYNITQRDVRAGLASVDDNWGASILLSELKLIACMQIPWIAIVAAAPIVRIIARFKSCWLKKADALSRAAIIANVVLCVLMFSTFHLRNDAYALNQLRNSHRVTAMIAYGLARKIVTSGGEATRADDLERIRLIMRTNTIHSYRYMPVFLASNNNLKAFLLANMRCSKLPKAEKAKSGACNLESILGTRDYRVTPPTPDYWKLFLHLMPPFPTPFTPLTLVKEETRPSIQ